MMGLALRFLDTGCDCDFGWVGDESARSFRRILALGFRSLFLVADIFA